MSSPSAPQLPLCAALKLDAGSLARRREWLGLGDAEIALLRSLDHWLESCLNEIVESLHENIAHYPEIAGLLSDTSTGARVMAAQKHYFQNLTRGDFGLPHAEERLRVGFTHARIGLTPAWFLGAYQQFGTSVKRLLRAHFAESPEGALRAGEALDKAIFFDLGLTLEAYYFAAQQKTDQLAHYYGEVLDHIPAGILVVDARGCIATANLALRRMLEIGPDAELLGRPVDEWLALPGLERGTTGVAKSEDAPARFELRRLSPAGEKHFHVSATGIRLKEQAHSLVVLQDISRLRRAQDELRRFRTAIDASADAIFLVDRVSQKIIDANETACRLYGHPRRELIAKDLQKFHPGFDAATQESLVHHLESAAEPVETTETRAIRDDGSSFPVALDLCLAYFGNERIVVVVARDISERIASEQTLRRLHRRFRDLVALSSDWFWEQDAQFRFLAFSPSDNRRAIGVDDRQVLGVARWEMPSALQDSADWVSHRADLAAHRPFRDFVYAVRDPQHQVHWISASGVPLYDEESHFAGYYGTAQDITEIRQAEIDLARRSAELESILHNALVGIVFVANGRVLRANRKAAELFATTAEAMRDLPAARFFGEQVLEDLQARSGEFGQTPSLQSVLRLARGETESFFANLSAATLHPDDPLAGSVWVIEDVTARREAEEALLRAQGVLEQRVAERTHQLRDINQELEAFSYSVSHDLRAPLRAINGFSEILGTRYSDALDTTGQDYLRRVRSAAQRMDEQIEGLLQLSRVSQSPLARQEVDLSSMAQEVLADLARGDPQRQVATFVMPGLHASGDRALLQLVLQNLLSNAWKYTQRRDQAEIQFRAETGLNGEPVFAVSDNGAGFDMAHADRLFGAFQRLHRPDDFPGHGIGLATTKRIINRHGGRIWAEAAVDEGACFWFTLS